MTICDAPMAFDVVPAVCGHLASSTRVFTCGCGHSFAVSRCSRHPVSAAQLRCADCPGHPCEVRDA